MNDNESCVMVHTTIDDEAAANSLAMSIIESRLAACVQRTRIGSTYRWKGAIESADEWLLTAKTRGSLADALCDFIKRSHKYEVPEIIVAPIVGGNADYLDWVVRETKQSAG